MVSNGQQAILAGHPEQSIISALLILFTVVAVNFCGDRLAETFELGES
jgi:ABC-type dipeptide/oligopeptide/nickel transport system permease subunit